MGCALSWTDERAEAIEGSGEFHHRVSRVSREIKFLLC
jgi:hypothetical protein